MVRPVSIQWPVTLGYRQKARFNPNYIHRGIDYGCPTGTPVVATTGGTVVYAGRGGGYGPAFGIHVVIRTGNIWHLYGHLSAESVSVGQDVAAGQEIGRSGATGNVTGPHLHYAEFTQSPAAYQSDRSPRFIDAAATSPAAVAVFDVSFWAQAAARWFGVPWADRAKGIAAEIKGNEAGSEASVHAFTEVYGEDQAATISGALPGFTRVPGRAGLELFFDASKWNLLRPAKSYASGIQGRWALVVHLTRATTGQHVAFVVTHGPVTYSSLKAQFGAWLARLLYDVDGPIVLCGDFNRNSKSPRTEVERLGYRTMRAQASIANESAHEFPSKKWNLSDIYTIPAEARITGGEIDLTSPKLSDHRRIEARVVVGTGSTPKPPPPPPPAEGDVLELSKFKRTLPTGEPDHPTEVYPLKDTTGPVTFRAPVDGVTTENTDYSRDELREMHPKSWSADDGKHHKLEAICRVTEMPGRKAGSKYVPGTVIGQFHDKSDDIVILLVNVNGQVIVEEGLGKNNGSEKHVLFDGYRLGDELHYLMNAHGEGIDVTVNGHHVRIDKVAKDAYGKAGVYNRGNETNATGASSADFLKLKASHA